MNHPYVITAKIALAQLHIAIAEAERELSPELKSQHWVRNKSDPQAWTSLAYDHPENLTLDVLASLTGCESQLTGLIRRIATHGQSPDLRLGKMRPGAQGHDSKKKNAP